MSRRDSTWVVTAVQLASSASRKELMRHERTLSESESHEALAAVGAFGLWKRKDFAWNWGVDDGALWVAEGRRGTGYHPVRLANADHDAAHRLAIVFLKMAGIEPSVRRACE